MATKPTWRGLENIPREGGVIIVANHVTILDPVTLAHAIYDGVRRTPSFLAKSELFKVPVLGALLRKAGQIPVYRRTRDAVNSLRDAEAALVAGECVVIYPEGTCTRDPNGWPMVAKTGVARLVLDCRRTGHSARALGDPGDPALRLEAAASVPSQARSTCSLASHSTSRSTRAVEPTTTCCARSPIC